LYILLFTDAAAAAATCHALPSDVPARGACNREPFLMMAAEKAPLPFGYTFMAGKRPS